MYQRYNNKEIQHNCKCIYWHKPTAKCRCIQHPMNPQFKPIIPITIIKLLARQKITDSVFVSGLICTLLIFTPHKKQCHQLDLCVDGTARCYYFLKFALGIINTNQPRVKFFNCAISRKILTMFVVNIDVYLSMLNLYQFPSDNTPPAVRHAQNIPW